MGYGDNSLRPSGSLAIEKAQRPAAPCRHKLAKSHITGIVSRHNGRTRSQEGRDVAQGVAQVDSVRSQLQRKRELFPDVTSGPIHAGNQADDAVEILLIGNRPACRGTVDEDEVLVTLIDLGKPV